MVTIVQKNDPVLRKIAAPVPIEDIKSPKITAILADMKKALSTQDDGVALAAPQIGVSLRIFVVSGKVFDMADDDYGEEGYVKKSKDLVFINPEILKLSRERKFAEEGCLSVRYLYGKIKRATKAKIRAFDEDGLEFEMGASGLLAQIFQHETDHLEGKLFIDEATQLKDMPPQK